MSEMEEDTLDLDHKPKKKVRKRKSKPVCDDEDQVEAKIQQKSKKIKVETPKPNNPLLKWLNKSTDSCQISPYNEHSGKQGQENINKNITEDDFFKDSANEAPLKSNSSQTTQNSKNSIPVVDKLSKIDFSNLKAKLTAKLSLPKVDGSATIENGTDNALEKSIAETNDKIYNISQNIPILKDRKQKVVSAKRKSTVQSKSIKDMFQKKNSQSVEEIKLNEGDIESEAEYYEDVFQDNDDSGMIFISNKYECRKVVDSTDNESVDSYGNTPVKSEDIMAPPYSPLSPLVRKSPGLRSPLGKSSARNISLKSPKGSGETKMLEEDSKISKNLFESSVCKTEEPAINDSQNVVEEKKNEKRKKSMKPKKKTKSTSPNNEEVVNESTNNKSDEDFVTPKNKTRKSKTKEDPIDEKLPKVKAKKKDSPNLNSSLLNYFKRVDKKEEVSAMKEEPTVGPEKETEEKQSPSVEHDINLEISSNEKSTKKKKRKKKKSSEHRTEEKRNDNNVETVLNIKNNLSESSGKKKRVKKKKTSCVQIRFDFESDVSRDVETMDSEVETPKDFDVLSSTNNEPTNLKEEKVGIIEEKIREEPLKSESKDDEEIMQCEAGSMNKTNIENEEEEDVHVENNQKVEVAEETENFRNEETHRDLNPDEIPTNNDETVEKVNEDQEMRPDKPETIEPTRKRGRPKKETPVELPKEKVELEDKADIDDKENHRRSLRRRKTNERKELQERCDNVDVEDTMEEKRAEAESVSLFKYFKKVDTLEVVREEISNTMKVVVQVHTPPTTPSKWKRNLPSPPVPHEDNTGGRRKSSRISEKKQKEETRRMEDEILVLADVREKKDERKGKKDADDDDVFILKEKKKSTLSTGPQSKGKLASIFMKKPKLSKIEKEARQAFLQSGVPEAIRRQTEMLRRQEEILEELEFYTFPVINHVTQTLSTTHSTGQVQREPHDMGKFKLRSSEVGESLRADSEMLVADSKGNGNDAESANSTDEKSDQGGRSKEGTFENDDNEVSRVDTTFGLSTRDVSEWTSLIEMNVKEDVDENEEWVRPSNLSKALNVLKKRVPSIEHSSVFKRVADRTKDKHTHKIDTEDPLVLWSEKYKPESDRDVLGNGHSVETLRNWLEMRKKVTTRPYHSDGSDYESDFMDEDSSSQYNSKHNTAILIGPSGCGKTSTVYALANQLGYKVIELNASCNRNGKRILADLSEATQSHQVSHQAQSSSQITNFFGVKNNALFTVKPSTRSVPDIIDLQSHPDEKAKKRKRKRNDDVDSEEEFVNKKSGRGRKPGKRSEETGEKSLSGKEKIGQKSNNDTKGKEKIADHVGKNVEEKIPEGKSQSIILIEDADVLFSDHDEGFLAALTSLVAGSKRPLVLVANSERVGHLTKLMRSPSSLVLTFEMPLYSEIGCYLQLVSILENVKLSQDKSLLLVEQNGGDMRKCLLVLQFYILSKRVCTPTPSHVNNTSGLTSFWWQWCSLYNLPPFISNLARTRLTLTDNEPENEINEPRSNGRNGGGPATSRTSFLDDEFFCGEDDVNGNSKISKENDVNKNSKMSKENDVKISKNKKVDIENAIIDESKTGALGDEMLANHSQSEIANQATNGDAPNKEKLDDVMEVDLVEPSSENIVPIDNDHAVGKSKVDLVEHASQNIETSDAVGKCKSDDSGSKQDSQESGYNSGFSQPLSQHLKEDTVLTERTIPVGNNEDKTENITLVIENKTKIDNSELPNQDGSSGENLNRNLTDVGNVTEAIVTNSETSKADGKDENIPESSNCTHDSALNDGIEQTSGRTIAEMEICINSAELDRNLDFLRKQFGHKWTSREECEKERRGMQVLANVLRCASQADVIHRRLELSSSRDSNPCPQLWHSLTSASSSLDYDVTSCSNDVTSRELCATLVTCGRALLPGAHALSVNEPCEATKRSTTAAFTLQHSLLSSLSPLESLSRQGFPLDLYPGIRTLARNETARFATSSKRYNRFFNHLKSVGIHLTQSETERLCRSLWLE